VERLPLAPEELRDLLLSVGTHQRSRRLNPVEVGRLFSKSLVQGATLEDCAQAVHLKGPTMVQRFLRLLALDPWVQDLVDWGQSGSTLSFTAASELTRLPGQDQSLAVRSVLELGLSKSETIQLVQLVLRSGRPARQCGEEVVAMRSVVERRHVVIGSIVCDDLARKLGQLHQDERDLLLAKALSEVCPSLHLVGSRLGPERFTLVGGDELGELAADDARSLEVRITEAIKSEAAR
jgi:hypothetical protein